MQVLYLFFCFAVSSRNWFHCLFYMCYIVGKKYGLRNVENVIQFYFMIFTLILFQGWTHIGLVKCTLRLCTVFGFDIFTFGFQILFVFFVYSFGNTDPDFNLTHQPLENITIHLVHYNVFTYNFITKTFSFQKDLAHHLI